MRRYFLLLVTLACFVCSQAQGLKMVFVSDLHYGIFRPHFRGQDSVPAYVVNAAQVAAIKKLPQFNAIVVTGDIANRQEPGIQSATISWKQFQQDYTKSLTRNLFVVPGNHDESNAIGHPKITNSIRDAGAIAGIYNLEKSKHIYAGTYNQKTDRVNYSRNLQGVHCMFIDIWPDSTNRIWMEKDLSTISPTTPVLLFAHDPPEGDAKHFTKPVVPSDSVASIKFEHLLPEIYKDNSAGSTAAEQTGFIAFLKKHPNIKGYFHGHENYYETYDYHNMPVFRADSPMKGKTSREDETALSFQVITINKQKHQLTVQEFFWNTFKAAGKLVPGKSRTVNL